MPGRVPGGEIARRSRELHRIADTKKGEFYANQIGERLRVLFEERLPTGHFVGFSDNYVKVGVVTEADLSNRMGVVEVASVLPPRRDDRAPLLAAGPLVEIENA
jgi:tRNA A37 methylthiotransferase MiaB